MNHGLKVNGNILEITLPEEVHIDRVMVNRQMFSQRMQVCKSCKYHGLEGHEEPCVSCEVGNSNYVPSVELEERTKERTKTHACDCVSRQDAIDAVNAYLGLSAVSRTIQNMTSIQEILENLPSAEPQRIKGKWALQSDDYHEYYECDQCGIAVGIDDIRNFCPNCGAKTEVNE